jgi:hypothetical protein
MVSNEVKVHSKKAIGGGAEGGRHCEYREGDKRPRGICRSAASTAIIASFLAVVTLLLEQVQHAAVLIYSLRVNRRWWWRDRNVVIRIGNGTKTEAVPDCNNMSALSCACAHCCSNNLATRNRSYSPLNIAGRSAVKITVVGSKSQE